MVYPLVLLLHRHPHLNLLGVPLLPPRVHVHDHHPRVEITRLPSFKRLGQRGVRPEIIGEIKSEIGMTIFWSSDDFPFHVDAPELGDVVDDDEVGVEVYDAFDVVGDGVGEVDSGIVQGLVEGLANGLGDLAADAVGVEAVDLHVEVGEGGVDAGEELRRVGVGGEEVEGEVLRAGGVLEHGEDGGHGATEVVGVEGHGDVDYVRGTFVAVAEGRSLAEEGEGGRGTADEAEADGGGEGEEDERQEAN